MLTFILLDIQQIALTGDRTQVNVTFRFGTMVWVAEVPIWQDFLARSPFMTFCTHVSTSLSCTRGRSNVELSHNQGGGRERRVSFSNTTVEIRSQTRDQN